MPRSPQIKDNKKEENTEIPCKLGSGMNKNQKRMKTLKYLEKWMTIKVAELAGSPRLKNDLKSPDLPLWSPEKW